MKGQVAHRCAEGMKQPEEPVEKGTIAKALLGVLALLFGIGVLVGALEWMATDHSSVVRPSGTRPVQLDQGPEVPRLVP